MKSTLALLPFLALAGCFTSADFDVRYEDKFCEEWVACNPAYECADEGIDRSGCVFNKQAAKACLSGTWACNQDNTAAPYVVIPAECSDVYTQCDGAPTGTPAGTTTTSDTGT